MSDDVQHSTHRSATSAARALLASPEAAATVAASPAVSRLLAPPGMQTPMAPVAAAGSTAAAPTPANQSASIPPRRISLSGASPDAAAQSTAPTLASSVSAPRRSSRARQQRVQEDSFVDPVFQLRRNRQWTHLAVQSTGGCTLRTPTTIPNLDTAASPPLISRICNDVAAAIETVFLTTNLTATSTQMLAALVSESYLVLLRSIPPSRSNWICSVPRPMFGFSATATSTRRAFLTRGSGRGRKATSTAPIATRRWTTSRPTALQR